MNDPIPQLVPIVTVGVFPRPIQFGDLAWSLNKTPAWKVATMPVVVRTYTSTFILAYQQPE
jgi:hypothetical protein